MYGRSTINITPAAKFDSEPCSARPTARPAAPRTAITAVVLTPTVSSAATITTTIKPAYATLMTNLRSEMSTLLRAITRSSAFMIVRAIQRPTTKITRATISFTPNGTRYRLANWRTSSNVIVAIVPTAD